MSGAIPPLPCVLSLSAYGQFYIFYLQSTLTAVSRSLKQVRGQYRQTGHAILLPNYYLLTLNDPNSVLLMNIVCTSCHYIQSTPRCFSHSLLPVTPKCVVTRLQTARPIRFPEGERDVSLLRRVQTLGPTQTPAQVLPVGNAVGA
jgi:hypothetical protein